MKLLFVLCIYTCIFIVQQDDFYEKYKMWKDVMKGMKCPIEDQLVRLLHASGFNNYNAFKSFEETDFGAIEEFVTSGELERRVGKKELPLYLGNLEQPSQFKFIVGEKKTVRSIVNYIQKNHKEEEKYLGKNINLYPMFKKARTSRDKSVDKSCSDSSPSKTVATLNVPGEVSAVQKLIKVFFLILNEIEMTLLSNKEVISALEARCKELSIDCNSTKNFELSNLLSLLMETAQKNSARKNHGQRYEEDLKLFAAYLYIIGGRVIYEFLWANLPNSLPSVSTVNLILKSSSQPAIEGLFRFQELKDFLPAHDSTYP